MGKLKTKLNKNLQSDGSMYEKSGYGNLNNQQFVRVNKDKRMAGVKD